MAASLFDIEKWKESGSNPDELPEEIRNATTRSEPPKEVNISEEVQKALNSQRVEDFISSVKARVPSDNYESVAEKIRNAVIKGGLSLSEAEKAFVPEPEPKENLETPPNDPAGNKTSTPPPSNREEVEKWNAENFYAKRKEVVRWSTKRQLEFRRKNPEFLKMEMELFTR